MKAEATRVGVEHSREPILYPIIDTAVCDAAGLDPAEAAEACFRGGARLIQIRDKNGSSAAFLALTERVVRAARAYGGHVIVNDRADVARLAGAAGVHLGQDDLDVTEVFKIVGANATVGVSTHTRAQIDAALGGRASYIAVGPVFSTATKETGYDARGLALVTYAAGRGKPIVAIGGITLKRARAAIEAGASAVAVISDLLTSGDIEARTRAFVAALPARPFNV